MSSGRDWEAECGRLARAQLTSRIGSWEYDPSGVNLLVSEAVWALHGMPVPAVVSNSEPLRPGIHPQDLAALEAAMERLRTHGEAISHRYRVTRANDGAERWFAVHGAAQRDSSGAISCLEGTICDITELVQAEYEAQVAHDELSQAHSFQQAVIAATPDAIHIYDVASRQLSRANRSGRPLIGFTAAAIEVLAGKSMHALVPADDLQALGEALDAATGTATPGDSVKIRHAISEPDGSTRWLSRQITPFTRNEMGAVTQLLVVSRDVTDVVEMETRLQFAAWHDELTGLPNRRLILDRLEQSLLRTARGGSTAVLLCDLDGFKRINDTYGHHVGDQVLTQIATRITAATRPGDTAGRLGGDEFVLVIEVAQGQDPQLVCSDIARRLVAATAEPIIVEQRDCAVTASVGICIADKAASAESVLSDADAAMYYVKTHGADDHIFFEPAHRPNTASHDHVRDAVKRALANDLVEVYYQPVVDPRTDAVYAVEALARIRHSDGTFLDTGEAITVAEQTGLITALDERVLQRACSQAATWRREPEHRDLILKLNRSVTDITKPGFHDRISAALLSSGLDPTALTLEITETVLLDATEENLADLRRLHALGVGLAIDDFGTGYASLRYLAELPITCIKIDRSFTAGLPDDQTCMTLVRATVGLAQQLNIICVVEGVETIEQLHVLPDYSRLLIQGYLYARPKPAHHVLPAYISPEAQTLGPKGAAA